MLEKKTPKSVLFVSVIAVTLLLLLCGKVFFNLPEVFGPWFLLIVTLVFAASASGSLHLYHKHFMSRYLKTALITGSCALISSLILISHLA